ncbi:hypothetical protein DPV78_007605 [Talaromyces pinophilus]|nr:hypothetical protein DPV78_007605 [Talaromyces pinophilus]
MAPNNKNRQSESRIICNPCRARKVRCDGRREGCGNCTRLSFPCSYSPTSDSHLPAPALPRRRARQACNHCHSRKARCSGQYPECDRCRSLGRLCVYPDNERRGRRFARSVEGSQTHRENPTPETTPHDPRSPLEEQELYELPLVALDDFQEPHCNQQPNGSATDYAQATGIVNTHRASEDNGTRLETSLLDNKLYERALANFFEQLHAIPMFSFLHRVSLVQRFQAGVTDEPVLLAITGLAFLLTDMGTSAEDDGTAYIDRAEFLASQSLEQPSVLTVQTLVLVIGHRMFCHRFSSAFTLMGVAVRLAMWLRLNVEKLEVCFLAREACRRLMWSLFVLDKMLTGGYRDFLMCSAELMRIQLPCPDRNFELDLPREEEFLLQSREHLVEREPSPWTFYIRVMHLRHEVLQFSKSAASISPTTPEDVGSHIEAMKRCLDDFASLIPTSFRFSQSNLALRAYSSELWPFLMTHLVLHSSYCILHRLVLSGLKESLPKTTIHSLGTGFTARCVSQCAEHVLNSAVIFEAVVSLPDSRAAMDPWFAVCAYQCARILVFLWHNNPDFLGISGDTVSAKVKCCTEAIQKFRCETIFIQYIVRISCHGSRESFMMTNSL